MYSVVKCPQLRKGFPNAVGALWNMVGARAALVKPGHSVNKCGAVEQYVHLQTVFFLSFFTPSLC